MVSGFAEFFRKVPLHLKIKCMNAKTALCMALLQGKTISIRTGFLDLGLTNIPREVSRSVEKPFGVIVTRLQKNGKSRWGCDCIWFEYRLEKSEINREGIEKMKQYVRENTVIEYPKTAKQILEFKQTQLLLQ